MSWTRVWKALQRTLFLPSQANRDIDDEIRFHLEEETRLQSSAASPTRTPHSPPDACSGTSPLQKRKRGRSGYRRVSNNACRTCGSDAAS